MQTLGLSESTPRPEKRLKNLFWPTIENDVDLDYITEQGFWVCWFVAGVTEIFSIFAGHALAALFDSIFFLLAGVGVRMRSRGAAIIVFCVYLLSGVVL